MALIAASELWPMPLARSVWQSEGIKQETLQEYNALWKLRPKDRHVANTGGQHALQLCAARLCTLKCLEFRSVLNICFVYHDPLQQQTFASYVQNQVLACLVFYSTQDVI